ncbi:hypothetical protein [Actinoplanes solisilvae]|uniref:hypothetical protein n=1 Tax=Actinoplanes solisilvae TaxID=2486853 RepID=UPI001F0B7AC6|nr:hypothetical protein [Actinoplanes solisilvae]
MSADTVSFDAAAAYPEVAVVREKLATRDWAEIRRIVDGLTPAGRTTVLDAGAETPGVEDMLRDVLERDPGDSAAAVMLANRLIDIGWEIRSGAAAEHVTSNQFAEFHDWLRQAEAVLIDAVARNPRDPALWTARLITARGLQMGLAETRRRYDRVAALDPHHLPAQTQFLQTLCPKWSGSWEQLHPWCRDAMLAAPPGAVQGMLVAQAIIERWAALPAGTGTAYLKGAPAQAELDEAARRSVLHPAFGRDYGWVQAANTFAFAYSLSGDRRGAAAMFRMLEHRATRMPWGYLGDNEGEIFDMHRRRAMSGGAR